MIRHHRRPACGWITCGEQDPDARDTPFAAAVTCERCIAELHARGALLAGNSAGNYSAVPEKPGEK